jgi:hypothetical protein
MGSISIPKIIIPMLALLVSSCAGKPWTTLVNNEENTSISRIFTEMQKRDSACPCCLDAETTIAWDGPGQDRTITGFLQFKLPSSLKFVMLNPLGQPLYALVSDGQTFQSINTTQRQHTTGTISGLAMQYNIPEALISGKWGYWLTGRLQENEAVIEAIHKDESNRGAWVTMRHQEKTALSRSHLLIQPDTRQLLVRILVDQRDETIATIVYNRQKSQDSCTPAPRITITDLPYGSRLDISMADILTDHNFSATNFRLKIPAEYEHQEVP